VPDIHAGMSVFSNRLCGARRQLYRIGSVQAIGIVVVFASTVVSALAQVVLPGDAQRGAELFKTQHCVECHSVNGEGGKGASDLARKAGLATTSFLLTNLMWNHAPSMWMAMEKRGIQKPVLSEAQAADLFGFFWASRYFERPGDETRGKQVYVSKHCAGCHALSSAVAGGGPPISAWASLGDPISLASHMWNHSAQMQAAMAKKDVSWPRLDGQELTDLLAYLQSNRPGLAMYGEFGSAEAGQKLFQQKGCASCHMKAQSLENRRGHRTMADLAAALWDHEPEMRQPPPRLTATDMRDIVAYLWSIQYFDPKGDAKAGKKVFAAKKCGICHNDRSTGAPQLTAASRSPFAMVAVLWQHGPAMLGKMREKQIPWPRFQGTEMADLTAYLNELK
jgi:mono/diheme cytochrome c family protein